MSDRTFDPGGVGPLYHHGPELFPVFDLIVGGGLPLAAAIWVGRLRSVRARLAGGSGGTGGAIPVEGQEPVAPLLSEVDAVDDALGVLEEDLERRDDGSGS